MGARARAFCAALLVLAGALSPRPGLAQEPGYALDNASLTPRSFDGWAAWAQDNHARAYRAMFISCQRLLVSSLEGASVVRAMLTDICRHTPFLGPDLPPPVARQFFEENFRPVGIAKLGESAGFVTAYYEPEVRAARVPTATLNQPFLLKPDDLVSSRPLSAGFDSRAPAGRMVDGRLAPYFDRAEIEKGALAGRGLEIAYAHPTDVFFTQIQGSARLRFDDGTSLRIGYAAYNGHRYTPIGRVLIERGIATRAEMGMDYLRAYLGRGEEIAAELRAQNRSYVFFRVIEGLGEADGPIGGQGVPLTDWRSLAIDRAVHAYGLPVFIEGTVPTGPLGAGEPFDRLMVAQDTGSAILGPARGDLYLGSGLEMGQIAGRVRHSVGWTLLLPRTLALAQEMAPLPIDKPRP